MGNFNEVTSNNDVTATYCQTLRKKGKLHKLVQRQGMTDCKKMVYEKEDMHTFTKHTSRGRYFVRLDYIYISPDLRKDLDQYGTIYWTHIELDHFPIWMTLQVSDKVEHRTDKKTNMRLSNQSVEEWEKWSEDMKSTTPP